MKRPLIGITVDTHNSSPYYESPFAYAKAVERAGGLPLLLPYKTSPTLIPQYLDLLNGLVFTGGNDLNPKSWQEEYHPKTVPVDPDRESFERALITEVERRRTPMLGICFGSQLMNVHRGGSLTQFIPELLPGSLEHRKLDPNSETRHPVSLPPNSTLASLIQKTEISANSSHKQCMNKIGQGLNVIATSPDGIIEALEDPTFPLFLAVQWHPERLAHNEPEHQSLFNLLIEKSQASK
jgi:putative glutamine amidotransferase